MGCFNLGSASSSLWPLHTLKPTLPFHCNLNISLWIILLNMDCNNKLWNVLSNPSVSKYYFEDYASYMDLTFWTSDIMLVLLI